MPGGHGALRCLKLTLCPFYDWLFSMGRDTHQTGFLNPLLRRDLQTEDNVVQCPFIIILS